MAQESQSVFAWGKLQTNYTTEVAIANDGFRQICKEGYEKPVFSSPNVGNEGYSTGSAFATQTSKDKDDVTFSGSERATFELLGFLAAMGFGVVASPTTVTSGHAASSARSTSRKNAESSTISSRTVTRGTARRATTGCRA